MFFDDLAKHGLVIMPDFFSAEFCQNMKQVAQHVPLSKAAVGRGVSHQQLNSIRQDRTLWLDEQLMANFSLPLTQQQTLQNWLDWTDALRLQLNQFFRLSLKRFESHLACYSAGGGYAKHLDAFAGGNTRLISVVLYLNAIWQTQWGGQLRIDKPIGGPFASEPHNHTMRVECDHDPSAMVVVEPTMGTLVMFFSEWFPHQVLPAHEPRFSISGWYRVDI